MQVAQGAQEATVAMKPQLQETTASVSIFGLLSQYLNQSQAVMPGTCPRRPAPFAILEALQHSTTVHDERRVERLVEALLRQGHSYS